MTAEEFVLARLAEEDILTEWAAKCAENVRVGVPPEILAGFAALWPTHPDYREEWAV